MFGFDLILEVEDFPSEGEFLALESVQFVLGRDVGPAVLTGCLLAVLQSEYLLAGNEEFLLSIF